MARHRNRGRDGAGQRVVQHPRRVPERAPCCTSSAERREQVGREGERDGGRNRGRHEAERGARDRARQDEGDVGEVVEHGAVAGRTAAAARKHAVEEIGGRGDREQRRGQPPASRAQEGPRQQPRRPQTDDPERVRGGGHL